MNKDVVIVGVFFMVALLLETTILALPLVLYVLLCLYVLKPTTKVIIFAFCAGIIVDTLLLLPLGAHSLFYLVSFLLILQYHRKFETATLNFVLFSAMTFGFVYMLLFGSFAIFLQTLLGTIIAGIIYLIFDKTLTPLPEKVKAYPAHLLSKR